MELYLEHQLLRGVDGISFLNSTLYVNNVFSGKLNRIPVGADGKAVQPVEVSTDQPLKGPDGMRAANGKANGEYDDFLTGFVTKDGGVWGRPVGVAVGNDGSLFVVDDGSRIVWHVTWVGK